MTVQRRPDPMSRRSFLLASASATLLAACASDPAAIAGPGPSAIRSLLTAGAVDIRSLAATDPGVRALAARLSKSRFIGLGEVTHGSHEDALLKSVLVQSLIENHGVRLVLLEANRQGAAQLDTYASGARTSLLAADAVRQAPVLRFFKTEVIADLLTWIRGWNAVNADQPVRVMGVDCQASSADAASALAALASMDARAADALRPALSPILTEAARLARHDLMMKQITTSQLRAAETACRSLESSLLARGQSAAAIDARRAWQGLSAFEHETSDGDLTRATPEYWSRRDLFMAANAVSLAKDQPTVFWAHNSHVAGGKPGGDNAGFVPSGAILREAFSSNYAALTQDFRDASFLAINTADAKNPDAQPVVMKRRARPGSLNALLGASRKTTAWFDVAGLPASPELTAWRSTPIGLDWYGANASPDPLAADIRNVPPENLFDVMVIHPKLTPSRML